ncbi:hypothetical protein N0V93_009684 [Gnomoniopsis smithogilvyi]|uniref:FAD-binding PCMH-type domain-containing protein n=1 Tax=Gnomoniopsis smithogilvyi TaxID=1191159 RepID=A0A9W9CT19_9PEZI|nr:hypothetical protein N0V93_009684 [Gnomoniopsis smithogilvyi]
MRPSFSTILLGLMLAISSLSLADSCCEILGSTLPGKVLSPGSATYTSLNNNRCSPRSTSDVSVAVAILSNNNCPFAIKSGGHTAIPGANDIDDGVMLDLSYLNDTSVAPDNQTVHLGAGGTWQNAYDTLPSDIVFPGGECGGTGVAGVSLGGGMSLYLAAVGWVADNIRNFEVVLASGEVVDANATSNADLYHALKGGSSNFGVVTHIDLETISTSSNTNSENSSVPIPGAIYVAQVVSPAYANVTEAVLGNLVNFTLANNDDPLASAQIIYQMASTGDSTVDVIMTHNDGISAPIIEQSLSISPVLASQNGVIDMSTMAAEATEIYPDGYRDLAATYTFVNDLATALAIQNVTEALNTELQKEVPNMNWIFSYTPLPSIATQQSLNRGGNILGLDRKVEDRIVLFLSPRWQDAQYDGIMYNATQTWYQRVDAVARALHTNDDFLYLNFAGGFQNPLASYGNGSLDFLRGVAQKYDPAGIFQRLVPGGFKLTDA